MPVHCGCMAMLCFLLGIFQICIFPFLSVLFQAFPQFLQINDRLEPVNMLQLISSSVQFNVYNHTTILLEMMCDLKISAFE
jgi:hypothetical protein